MMKKALFNILTAAALSLPLLFAASCESEEEPIDPGRDKDGNVARVIVEVGAVTESEGENLYYDAVPGIRVYMFTLADWDASEKPDTEKAKIVITDENGFATFDFKEEQFDENQNFVFAVKDSTNAFVSVEMTLKKGKTANLTLYATGEKSKGAKYSNLVKTY
ncbi:MAG: hypothetical protein J6U04_04620 [Salinivirgaceae bacterium]|nr:hypothetical protein [Salinivirgaceae bacterium]